MVEITRRNFIGLGLLGALSLGVPSFGISGKSFGNDSLVVRRASAGIGDRYTAMALKFYLNDDLIGLLLGDLRGVVNIAPSQGHSLDKYSFASMALRGPKTINARLYFVEEFRRRLGDWFLRDMLRRHVSLDFPVSTLSKENLEEIVNGSISVLLPSSVEGNELFFVRPTFSYSGEPVVPPRISKFENVSRKGISCRDISDEEFGKYQNFSVSTSIFEDLGKYSHAAIVVGFDGQRNDLVGILDLRNLEGASPSRNPLNEYDLRGAAFWGSAPIRVYATPQSYKEYNESKFLKWVVRGRVFHDDLRIDLVDRSESLEGDFRGLLPLRKNPFELYFFPPKITGKNSLK